MFEESTSPLALQHQHARPQREHKALPLIWKPSFLSYANIVTKDKFNREIDQVPAILRPISVINPFSSMASIRYNCFNASPKDSPGPATYHFDNYT